LLREVELASEGWKPGAAWAPVQVSHVQDLPPVALGRHVKCAPPM